MCLRIYLVNLSILISFCLLQDLQVFMNQDFTIQTEDLEPVETTEVNWISKCRWDWVAHLDENRFPRVFQRAVCRNTDNECKTIYKDIVMFRKVIRHCIGLFCGYERYISREPVACVSTKSKWRLDGSRDVVRKVDKEVLKKSLVSATEPAIENSIDNFAAALAKHSGRITGVLPETTESKRLRSSILHALKRSQIQTEKVTYNNSTSGESVPSAKRRKNLGRKSRRHRRNNHRRRKARKRQKKTKGKRKKRRKMKRKCGPNKKEYSSGDWTVS